MINNSFLSISVKFQCYVLQAENSSAFLLGESQNMKAPKGVIKAYSKYFFYFPSIEVLFPERIKRPLWLRSLGELLKTKRTLSLLLQKSINE